ncbi:MAG: hypothetical protein ABW298_14525 [Candidatus Binatia bacterium]
MTVADARRRFAKVISRKANAFARFSNLALFIEPELDGHAVLVGELACFDAEGRLRFSELMFGRGDPAFVVLDDGRDLRELGLIEPKQVLRRLIPKRSSFVG